MALQTAIGFRYYNVCNSDHARPVRHRPSKLRWHVLPRPASRSWAWIAGLLVALASSTILAQETAVEEQLEGHSYHGEAFNEGPRQFARLIGGTGPISFEVSSDVPKVRPYIEQGIGQLHGFWYYEAERSFRHAAMLDPECAIAYWGMALANTNNTERAKEFINEAVRYKETASPREILLIDALHGYLMGNGNREKKAADYVAALEHIVEQYPDDLECQAQLGYALYQHRGRLKISHEDVDAVLKAILEREPLHPVHHYRIHLWDAKDPKLALDSSALCGASSPAIAHMWHMPGHIYSRLKRYHDAVWQQEASARVDHAHMMHDRVLPDQIHNFAHNNEWLIRNLIFIGRHLDAAELAANMIRLPRHPKYNTLSRRNSASFGRERLLDVLVQYERWHDLVRACEGPLLEPTDDARQQLIRLRYLGIAYSQIGDSARCQAVLDELDTRLQAAGEDDREDSRQERRGRRNGDRQRRSIESAIADVRAHQAVYRGDFAAAARQLEQVRDDRNELLAARIQSLLGEHAKAMELLDKYSRTHRGEVLPLAARVELLWRAGDVEPAREAMQELRELSGAIQFGTPVFDRVTAIALQLGLPSEWRIAYQPREDFGTRPPLDSLGPFCWQPSPAPPWSLSDADGHTRSLADYRGRPVIVVFFLGYGCLHCAEQLQALAPLYDRFEEAGIALVAISSDDVEGLRKSLENYEPGFPFPLVSDAALDVFRAYRAYDDFEQQALHGTFLIDADGLVQWQDINYEPFMDVEFLLNESQRLLTMDTTLPHVLAAAPQTVSPTAHAVLKPQLPRDTANASERISAAGIPGTVVLTASDPPSEVFDHLFSDEDDARQVVVIELGEDSHSESQRVREQLFARWNQLPATQLRLFRIDRPEGDDWQAALASLASATTVWVTAHDTDMSTALAQDELVPELRKVVARGGAVGLGRRMVSGVGERLIPGLLPAVPVDDQCEPSAARETIEGMGGFSSLAQRLAWMPRSVGVELGERTAVVIRGRALVGLGDGEIWLHYAPTEFHPARKVRLARRRRIADLTAVRRYAHARSQDGFPHQNVALPLVERGSLVIAGGGSMPRQAMQRFVELAGGSEASIVVIPISMPDPLPERDPMAEHLRRMGVERVTVLAGRTPEEVDDPAALEALRTATGVWFGGGRQWRFVDAYEGTEAERLLHDVLRRGGVIGGSSAGASIQGDYLARGNPLGPRDIMADGYERGMGFLPGVAIDQHFAQRRRQADLESLVQRYPRLLGIGIDESTALIVRGSVAEVVGAHQVHFYDPARTIDGTTSPVSLGDSSLYELISRKALVPSPQ